MTADPAPIRILSVDDHPLLREGIAALLSGKPDLQLVGEADNGRQAVERFRALRPDITLMDLQMPLMSGIDAILAIRADSPTARIIVLTTYAGDVLAQRALRAGAQAYLLKSQVRKVLIDAIRSVHAGLRWVDPVGVTRPATGPGGGDLTPKELEVLAQIAAGQSNKLIARHLGIAEGTVKTHVKSILAKLDARDRTHAATLGRERGVIGV